MQTIKSALYIFYREYLLTFRNVYNLLTIIVFFTLGILVFVFSIGPDKKIFSEIGIGIIWTILLLSTNLSIRNFYQDDFNDGSIIIIYINSISLEFFVIIKMIASWFFFQVPFLLIMPFACLILGINTDKILILLLTFIIGSPILTSLSSIACSLNLLNNKNFSIASVIVLLLSIPVIIFSVSIIESPIDIFWPQLNILLGILMLILAITPWISAICIRIAIRNQ